MHTIAINIYIRNFIFLVSSICALCMPPSKKFLTHPTVATTFSISPFALLFIIEIMIDAELEDPERSSFFLRSDPGSGVTIATLDRKSSGRQHHGAAGHPGALSHRNSLHHLYYSSHADPTDTLRSSNTVAASTLKSKSSYQLNQFPYHNHYGGSR